MLLTFVHLIILLVFWQSFLSDFSRDGRVDYSGVKKDLGKLSSFLLEAQSVSDVDYRSWSDEQKISFWLNVYNALTVKVVVDHYPIKPTLLNRVVYPVNSIQQISDVWNIPLVFILSHKVSLNYIEHKVLRAEFNEPRIHFALVCASVGCPSLRGEPYVASKLDTQLDEQAFAFLGGP